MGFKRQLVSKLSGNEKFFINDQLLNHSVTDFWRWSTSDLLSNTTRGVLAEYIIASALGITENPRVEWDAYDLLSMKGKKIEVKSAAYLQSWYQNKLSTISFSIKPARHWNANDNTYSEIRLRSADIYIFCLLNHKDMDTVNPLDLNQWDFFIVKTEELNSKLKDQKY